MPKPRRLNPGHAHRNAVLESLAPEQRPIAEQVLRGGIPAVRTALHLEREKALAEGRTAPKTDELVAMAESLLPRLKAAEWRDRAEAAAADVDSLSLRDLRSVVTGSEVARDEETRALATTLREALEARTRGMQEDWSGEITKLVDDGRVVRAVRLSSRPPEPSARLPVDVAERLATAAGEAMSPDCSSDLWASLLDAVAASPIRRSVVPAGLPTSATPELRKAAHQQSGNIPALAKLLGVSIPPPPQPGSNRRPTEGARRPARRGPRTDQRRAEPGPDRASADPAGLPEPQTGTSESPEPVMAGEPPTEPEAPTIVEVSRDRPAETDVAPDTTGPDTTGPHETGPHETGPHETGPHVTGPGTTGPAETGPVDPEKSIETASQVDPASHGDTGSPLNSGSRVDTGSSVDTAGSEHPGQRVEPAGAAETDSPVHAPYRSGSADGEPTASSEQVLGDPAPRIPDDEEEVVGSAER
jgi:hypothetical protein